jgi:hypothetical protein
MTAFGIIKVVVEALEMAAVDRREEEQLAIKEESLAWSRPPLVGRARCYRPGR